MSDAIADPRDGHARTVDVDANLTFLPAGEPREGILSDPAGALLAVRRAARDARVSLIDGPPVLGAAETSVIASAADGVLLVLFAGVTRRAAAARAAEQIRRVGGRVVGVVLIGAGVDDYKSYRSASDRVSDA